MPASIVTFAVGVICIVLGIINMRGNISSIHSYHRRRVAKENILPFGKKDDETLNSDATFESIPVQINESLIDKIKGKDSKKEEVEEMLEWLKTI